MYAHSPNEAGHWQDLVEHLRLVADEASSFAAPFQGETAARVAGLLHDIGKSGSWQRYLAKCAAEPERRHRSVDHKGAGALEAFSHPILGLLAFLIAGHHGGLMNQRQLRTWLNERQQDEDTRIARKWAIATGLVPFSELDFARVIPDFAGRDARACEFWLRLCFSALVDADYRDTERHFNPKTAANRAGAPSIDHLVERLAEEQEQLTGHQPDLVNAIRDEVYRACLSAAALAPGLFRLTVPTGGGKTRSGLSFGLNHAKAHGLRRVVVAVPFLSITDQTADVYRQVLGDDRAVLEHYSAAGEAEDAVGEPTPREIWRRLAIQDWDAPVVVTTTVQLFESLLSNSTRDCRKLHRLAKAVILLDEVQTLPVALLEPMLDVLTELVANYGTTVVLCTATQPAFANVPRFADRFASAREIAPDPARLFRSLRRVDYEWPGRQEQWSWTRVADALRDARQVLTIVNTKKDALSLLEALADPHAFHLSTSLCAAHRRDVLAVIRARLAAGDDCRVVSTQVVEAGVDLDFPLVFRAVGPLDSIVQAAGRCNREGKQERGRVVIFDPADGGSPGGGYRAATTLTAHLATDPTLDLHDPATFDRYFAELFSLVDMDARGIQALRAAFAFADVADRFRLIAEDTVSVVMPYMGIGHRHDDLPADRRAIDHGAVVSGLTQELAPKPYARPNTNVRAILTQVQPYTVALRRHAFEEAQRSGSVSELAGGLWKWERGFDDVRGLTYDADHERMVI
ncbi:MAG: CRISPR-associated endonuclease Cas3'' [Gemmatimonadota bacterium]|nr:CRISPR-associated endonuclease Cas3'' [Gemmatimonadota bacterium]